MTVRLRSAYIWINSGCFYWCQGYVERDTALSQNVSPIAVSDCVFLHVTNKVESYRKYANVANV